MAELDALLLDVIGEPIAGLEKLGKAEQKKLAADLVLAQGKHQAILKQSMEDALQHIPRFLRGTIQKMMGF